MAELKGGFDAPLVSTGHTAYLRTLVVDEVQKRVYTASGDGTVRISEIETGRCERKLEGHADAVRAICLRPAAVLYTGSRITKGLVYTASADATARAWDLLDGGMLRLFKGHSGTVTCLQPSEAAGVEGDLYTGSADGTVRAWDVGTGESRMTFRGHHKEVYSVSVWPLDNPDHVFSGSRDATIIIWDAVEGTALKRLREHEKGLVSGNGAVYQLVASHNRLFSAGGDGLVRVWETGPGDPRGGGFQFGDQTAMCEGHEHWVTCMYVHAHRLSKKSTMVNWTIFTGSFDRTARKFDGETGAELLLFRGHSAPVTAVQYIDEAKMLLTGAEAPDCSVRVWDTDSGDQLRLLQGHSGAIQGLALSDGVLFSASRDCSHRAWRFMYFGATLITFGSRYMARGKRADLQRKHPAAAVGDGVAVLDVLSPSPAQRAGLRPNDRIVRFDRDLEFRMEKAGNEDLLHDAKPAPPREVHSVADILGRAGLAAGIKFEMHVVRPPASGTLEERNGIFEELEMEYMTEDYERIAV
jgi:WD40 repeat protein